MSKAIFKMLDSLFFFLRFDADAGLQALKYEALRQSCNNF